MTNLGNGQKDYKINQQENEMTQSLPTPPDSFDWRTKGYVSKINNIGLFGSEGADSVVSSSEGTLAMKQGNLTLLSRQQLTDCMNIIQANLTQVYGYLKTSGGIETEADYPSTTTASCTFDATKIKAKYSGFKTLPKGDEESLKANVAANGQFVVTIVRANDLYFYHGGIYDTTECEKPSAYTDMLVIGYGSENGVDFWLLKNAWGTVWGEKGFIRLARGKNLCGVADSISQPIVTFVN